MWTKVVIIHIQVFVDLLEMTFNKLQSNSWSAVVVHIDMVSFSVEMFHSWPVAPLGIFQVHRKQTCIKSSHSQI